jgi:hypothetical protein
MTYPDRTNEKFQNMGRAIFNREIKIQQLTAEVERLRGLLGRLEWAAGICPACHVLPSPDRKFTGRSLHDRGCWLAEELAPDPPEGEQP